MTVESKIKAWHYDSKVMFDVLAISFLTKKIIVKWMGADKSIPGNQFIIIKPTETQDINGKDIYYGDIVKCFLNGKPIGALDSVDFKDGAFILKSRTVTLHEWNTMPNDNYTGELEVIGNIYENSNLLK